MAREKQPPSGGDPDVSAADQATATAGAIANGAGQPEPEIDMRQPHEIAIAEALKASKVERDQLPRYRNISGQKLPLTCGRTFGVGEVLGLTEDEVERFETAGRNARRAYIVKVEVAGGGEAK
jgi:hypothetical protein